MVRRGAGCVVCSLGLFLLALPPAWAQRSFGTVVGAVTDATSAVIPQAQVSLTRLGTREKRSATTDAGGDYQFVNVLPGNHRIDVEKEGFKHLAREPVVAPGQQATRIDVSIELG